MGQVKSSIYWIGTKAPILRCDENLWNKDYKMVHVAGDLWKCIIEMIRERDLEFKFIFIENGYEVWKCAPWYAQRPSKYNSNNVVHVSQNGVEYGFTPELVNNILKNSPAELLNNIKICSANFHHYND